MMIDSLTLARAAAPVCIAVLIWAAHAALIPDIRATLRALRKGQGK